ncbi:MAG: DNA-3-methyladenine glycosylase I [Ignavibacteriaceae bacterium]|nr:DNA-3-methyladenine glycosylase I [Ignavibacteriaceae bacterium]
MASYCDFVKNLDEENLHRKYHDTEYGFPLHDDNKLFERLCLEINQAGLNWSMILGKKDNFHKAFHKFNISKVAAYKEKDIDRLLSDEGIIRNRLKITSVIENAKRILELQKEFGSFENWLDKHYPKTLEEWVKIFKKQFKFTGGEIVNEFLVSIGYLPNGHDKSCPVYKKIINQSPAWSQKKR